MASDDDGVLHDFVRSRYPDLRRSAFLMCGDWALADELTQATLARYLAESARRDVEDPDAHVYADLMAAFRRRPARRERLFVAPDPDAGPPARDADPARAIVVLDALRKLSARCRAVLVLRHGSGFAVDETADVLGLTDERAAAYEAAGLAALEDLLARAEPAANR
jgi:DNA-directed RNA polymerase specialized sigma24 family protein